jgi:hypothetical protein
MGTRGEMRAWLSLFAAVGSALALLRAADGAEPSRTIDVSRALDASAPMTSAPDIAIGATQPDPAPISERVQWVFDLRWSRGEVSLLAVNRLELRGAQPTPRSMGRFAIELFEGKALVERLRFDFPLLGASEPDATPTLVTKLGTRTRLMFPATRRGTRLELLDRATNRRWPLPWPPRLFADAGID